MSINTPEDWSPQDRRAIREAVRDLKLRLGSQIGGPPVDVRRVVERATGRRVEFKLSKKEARLLHFLAEYALERM